MTSTKKTEIFGRHISLNATLDDVKLSFISFPYPLAFPLLPFEGLLLVDERDIAAMKISAIAGRGAKKDFVDLFMLMQKFSLETVLGFFETMFASKNYNRMHLLKSIAYFDDADSDPDPVMLEPMAWDEIKKTLAAEAHRLVR